MSACPTYPWCIRHRDVVARNGDTSPVHVGQAMVIEPHDGDGEVRARLVADPGIADEDEPTEILVELVVVELVHPDGRTWSTAALLDADEARALAAALTAAADQQ